MNRQAVLSLARLYVPEAPISVITDVNAYIILNEGAQQFVRYTLCLPTEIDFTCTADDKDYVLSDTVPKYLAIQREGLWWYNTVNSKWIQLHGTSPAYMWKNFPTWLNDSSGSPMRYWIDGDILWVHPAPDTTKATTGFKLFYFAKSVDVDADGEFFFSGSTTQIPWLSPYEETILQYYKWKVNQIIGYNQKAEEAKAMFYAVAEKAKSELLARPDLINQMKMKGAGNMSHFRSAYGGYGGGRR